ncbi:Helix-turn-helix domain-containing protein [Lentibacillus halodurans]|uniref:Helix-turn-helix domain-containing protein n=1 Tax=Lentibacillus halodurans TaxID=237679 RepID=A0A1I0XYG9_9BACI|nr:helix-turn-helix domain-containing protein [Lentibacillus halodurans]SFB05360.1 Helix-turn-helix domain-containing protein [Lentibacillus halodurans]
MKPNANVAKVATLVSESSRATILTILLDGRFHPASDLAYMAGITPQTASYHLSKMTHANVVDDSLIQQGLIYEKEKGYQVTNKGENFFQGLQIDLDRLRKKRRMFCGKCLDWSERRHHISRALGNALLKKFLEYNWIQHAPQSRALKVTAAGTEGFKH